MKSMKAAVLSVLVLVLMALTGCEFNPNGAYVADGGDAAVADGNVCTDDLQCGATRICVSGTCQPGCRVEGQICPNTNLVCRSGQCVESNPCGSLAMCGSSCVNLQSDNANCGACGRVCSSGQTCNAGVCTGGNADAGTDSGSCTGSGQTYCGGVCVNTQSDNANCGSCGHACMATESCAGGLCQPATGMMNIVLDATSMPGCAVWTSTLWDNTGAIVQASPRIDRTISASWNGWTIATVFCGGTQKVWTLGQTAAAQGVREIQVNGVNVTSQTMVCRDYWGSGARSPDAVPPAYIRLAIPMNPANYGQCPPAP